MQAWILRPSVVVLRSRGGDRSAVADGILRYEARYKRVSMLRLQYKLWDESKRGEQSQTEKGRMHDEGEENAGEGAVERLAMRRLLHVVSYKHERMRQKR